MLPLSFAQRRLWFLERVLEGRPAYHLPVALRLAGPLDVDALQAALGDLIQRHEVLRTVYPEDDGEPCQHILSTGQARPELAVVEVPARALDGAIRDAAQIPFDIRRDPPLRATLFVLGPQQAVLLLVLHHIATDGWSTVPLVRDLSAAYRARVKGLAPSWDELSVQYADYALWQRELLGSPDDPGSRYARELAHWRTVLDGLADVLALPADRPRPAVASYLGGSVPIRWGPRRHRRLADLARGHDCTLFMVIQAGLAVLLARLGAGVDIPIGTVVAGRSEAELDNLVGFFVNTVVLRTDVSGDPSFAEVLRRVRSTDLDAYAHQDLPFDCLVRELNPPRTLAHHPLFQVMLVLESAEPERPDFGPVEAAYEDVNLPAAKVDLTVQLREDRNGLNGTLEYAADLFDEDTARAVVERLERLLDAAAAAPETPVRCLDILSVRERSRILDQWNDTARPLPVTTLHAEFERRAASDPDAPALVAVEESLTYRELNSRANQLAHHLTRLGVTPGSIVGVAVRRSPALVVSLLATLKAGAAYLSLDASQPADRLAGMIEDADPAYVVVDRDGCDLLPLGGRPTLVIDDPAVAARLAAQPGTDPPPTVSTLDRAYVIFTSGSTGRPKGVAVSHRAIDNRLRWMQGAYPLTPADRVLQKTPCGFDVSVWEFFWPLREGAVLVLAAPDEHRDPARVARTIHGQRVTVVHFVPAMLDLFLAEPAAPSCASVRRVFCSGEALARKTVDEFHRVLPRAQLENLYGPTEAAVDVTAYPCRPGVRGPVPIGRPVWNTRVFVLDSGLSPCPVGVPGELYLAGAQLAEGYVGRPGLTAERFVANPYGAPGERMYRTGDLARWRPDGTLEYLGRTDRQVKLRGQRLELGEIESVLASDAGVASAVAVVRTGRTGEPVLSAYVTPAGRPSQNGARSLDGTALRERLTRRLPDFMVPAAVTVLEELPLSANGKVDVAALPAPHVASAPGRSPRTPGEEELVRLFAEVLGVPAVSPDDDFFALGGHSMLVVRLVRRIRQVLGAQVSVSDVFRLPTAAALARTVLDGDGKAQDAYGMLLQLRRGQRGKPFFFVPPGAGLSWAYFRMLEYVEPWRAVYGLQARGVGRHPADRAAQLPGSVGEMAEEYLAEIRKIQPEGPYHLLGWSFGGHVAHDIAVRLRRAGQQVAPLVMFDSYPNPTDGGAREPDRRQLLSVALANLLGRVPEETPVNGDPAALGPEVFEAVRRAFPPLAEAGREHIERVLRVGMNNLRLLAGFVPGTFDGGLTVITAAHTKPHDCLPAEAWQLYVTGRVDVLSVETSHHTMFTTGAREVGTLLSTILRHRWAASAQDR